MAHFTKEGCLDNEKKDWNHRRPILKTMTLETPKTSWSTCLGPMMKMHNSSFYQSKNACATPLSCCTWEEIIVVSNYSTNLIKYTFIYPCFEENRQVVNFSLIFTTYHLCHQTLVFIYLVRLSVSTTPINVWTESRSLVMDSPPLNIEFDIVHGIYVSNCLLLWFLPIYDEIKEYHMWF